MSDLKMLLKCFIGIKYYQALTSFVRHNPKALLKIYGKIRNYGVELLNYYIKIGDTHTADKIHTLIWQHDIAVCRIKGAINEP